MIVDFSISDDCVFKGAIKVAERLLALGWEIHNRESMKSNNAGRV